MTAAGPGSPLEERHASSADRFQIVLDPDSEPGDVLGALARLLISMAQEGVEEGQGLHRPPTN